MNEKVAAFDLDGTLWDHDTPQGEFENPEYIDRIIPNEIAINKVRGYMGDVHFITARLESCREYIQKKMYELGLNGPLVMAKIWEGNESMVQYKCEAISKINPEFYVGDTIYDEMAATKAGVAFIHADEWRKPEMKKEYN